MRSSRVHVLVLLIGMVCVSCGSNNSGGGDNPSPDYPNLDKFPELVEACSSWKTGGGASATGGGKGYTVYHVTTLDDNDPSMPVKGSLRYAVSQTGTRIIVFDTFGTIHLKDALIIPSNVSILGQSAPGQGICIADYPIIINQASNIIIRFIRLRLGTKSLEKPDKEYDALTVLNSKNILIDHCSFSWSIDECVSCYGNENFTLQYCFVTESLRDAGHPKGEHGYGGIWGGTNATFHHNLLAHHDSRTPRFDHDYVNNKQYGPIDFVNNVVYNWGFNSTYGGESVSKTRKINMVGNYYKYGPSTSPKNRLLNATTYCENCTSNGKVHPGSFYLEGNYMPDFPTTVSVDNWKGVVVDKKGTATVQDCKSELRHTTSYQMATQSAQDAFTTVLEKAGCSLNRDAVDNRIVEEVKNRGGKLINSPDEVGGWPELTSDEPIIDTDADGIPDEWEIKYGLDPNDKKDLRFASLVSGVMNLEVYLNDRVKHLY